MKVNIPLLMLFTSFFGLFGNQLHVEILVKPQIDSKTEKVVFIPSKNTPEEFIGYLSEQIAENSRLKVIDEKSFSDFLEKTGLANKTPTPENLVYLYKKFGFLSLIFIELDSISVKNKALCKRGNLSFKVSVFHVRDGTVLKNRNFTVKAKLCGKENPPKTADVVKILFDKSVVEILKLFTPWSLSLKLPLYHTSPFYKKVSLLLENGDLKKAYNLLNKTEKKTFEENVLLGNTLLLQQKFAKACLFFEKALTVKNDNRVSEICEKLKDAGIENLLKSKLIPEQKQKKPVIHTEEQPQNILESPFNKGDLLLMKLRELEKRYKNGEISEEEYMKKKYQLIEQF